MCMSSSAPKAPPPPPPPPADPEPVGEGVKAAREQDKQKQAFLANQTKRPQQEAGALMTPSTQGGQTNTLIGS